MPSTSPPPGQPPPESSRAARLAFLQWSDDDRHRLNELSAAVLPQLETLVHSWHLALMDTPAMKTILGGDASTRHLAQLQQQYFRSLFADPRDERFFAARERVGRVHLRVGLEPFWYLAAYSRFLQQMRDFLGEQGHDARSTGRWMGSLEKAVFLDVSLALDAYHQAQTEDLTVSNQALQALSQRLEKNNRELQQQIHKAEEGARLKREFLSRISHELRTPLHGVLGYADLIADGIQGPVTRDQQTSLAKIRTNGERLVEMVDQLIDAAKLASVGKIQVRTFSPEQAIATAAAEGRDAAQVKGLTFSTAVESPVPAVIGDAKGLVRALRHVIRNAVQFTAHGEVAFEVQREGDQVCFRVRDSGPGIPRLRQEQIFDPFFQEDAGDTGTCRGVGLGLTLARETVVNMGGQLELQDSDAEGSTFVLRLPAGQLPPQ